MPVPSVLGKRTHCSLYAHLSLTLLTVFHPDSLEMSEKEVTRVSAQNKVFMLPYLTTYYF